MVDGVMKEHRVLGDHPNAPPQAVQRDVSYVLPTNQDPPISGIIEPVEQPHNRGLAEEEIVELG